MAIKVSKNLVYKRFLERRLLGRVGLCHLINQVGYFTLMRESSKDLFGEYLLSIYFNFKNTTFSLN